MEDEVVVVVVEEEEEEVRGEDRSAAIPPPPVWVTAAPRGLSARSKFIAARCGVHHDASGLAKLMSLTAYI